MQPVRRIGHIDCAKTQIVATEIVWVVNATRTNPRQSMLSLKETGIFSDVAPPNTRMLQKLSQKSDRDDCPGASGSPAPKYGTFQLALGAGRRGPIRLKGSRRRATPYPQKKHTP